MDAELRRLEQEYQQSNDPLLREKLDVARSRAGLPISLPTLIAEISAFEERVRTTLRATLEYELSEYMRKHSSLVDHIRWYQQNARDLSWEMANDSTWIDDLRVMFKLDIRVMLFDEDDIMLWPSSDETGELDVEEDKASFKKHVEIHPTLRPQKEALFKAIDDAVTLTDRLRSLMEQIGQLFGQDVYVVYDRQNQLKVLEEPEFNTLIDSMSQEASSHPRTSING